MSKKDASPKKWKTLSSKVVHKNPWFSIIKDKIRRIDDSTGYYYLLKGKNHFVAIIAQRKNKIALIRQFRYAAQSEIWELPMGGAKKNEDYKKAAQREFLEETGLEAKKWTRIGESFVGLGHTSQKGIVFLAREVKKSKKELKGEVGEVIEEVKWFGFKELEKMIAGGKIKDGPTISALYLFNLYLRKKRKK